MSNYFLIYRKTIIYFAIFLVLIPYSIGASEGEISLSGPISVRLSYDDILAGKPVEKAKPKEKKCSGGGMLGAINCVTEKMEGVGDSIDSAGNSGTADGKKIRIALSGQLTPQYTELSEGKFEISLDVDLGKIEFSPSYGDIPGDLI